MISLPSNSGDDPLWAEKFVCEDGRIGCTIWYGDAEGGLGSMCFDFREEDIQVLIDLLNALRKLLPEREANDEQLP